MPSITLVAMSMKLSFNTFDTRREAARCAQIALDDFDVVVLGQELDIERAGYVESFGYGRGHFLKTAYGFDVEFLRRELYGGVAGVYA